MHPGNDVGAPLRLFFALWPDNRALAAVRRIAGDVARAQHGRASREENLHVTMAFIGEVENTRLPQLEGAGDEAARASRSFDLTFDRIGGNAHGIAWLAPGGVPTELRMLHEKLVARLDECGFPTERRAFRPHVTLARKCLRPARHCESPPVVWPVNRLSLVVSTLAPGGSRYADLAAWPLGDGGSERSS